MASQRISVLIAEDEAVTRFGMKYALHTFEDVQVIAECPDGISAILQALATRPDVILMDIGLPRVDGISASRKIKEALPRTKIIVFTGSDDDASVHSALDAGVDGYCLKKVSGEHLYKAIKAVEDGKIWIDPALENGAESGVDEFKISTGTLETTIEPERSRHGEAKPNELYNATDTTQVMSSLHNKADESRYAQPLNSSLSEEQLREQRASGANRTIIADRYQVTKVLGKGGMGMVYKGRHIYMHRDVAIKILHPEQAQDQAIVSRFRKEARSLCQFSHPNLVSVFDFGVMSSGEPFMVMDYCEGDSLDRILNKQGHLTLERGLKIFKQVCMALDAVHNQGIVHRDVKPSNMLVGQDDGLKLVDFGLAKSLGGLERLIKLTCTGEVVGSPSYMSPEQCTGQELDHRSDIYSLGVAMFEGFTGEMPFSADSFYELLNQHIRGTPSRNAFTKLKLPASLEEVIFKCLDKVPDGRYSTAKELLNALEAVG